MKRELLCEDPGVITFLAVDNLGGMLRYCLGEQIMKV